MKTKKFFALSLVYLLLLQPVLLGVSSSRSESANSRIQSQKLENTVKPAANQQTSPASAIPTQMGGADTAGAHQARSVSSGRKEHKSSFEKNVELCVKKIKSSYGSKEASAKPFVDAIIKIDAFEKNNNNNILSHVKKSIEPLKHLATGDQVTKSEAQQQLGIALLLKATLPLGLQAQEIICEMLHKLDTYIAYWREQKHHQISYYFHKNPQKWFSSQKQKNEIEDNLHFLKSVHDDHLRLLAKIAEHESLFNQSASLKDQYEWIAKYLSLISNICYGSQAKLDGIAADESIRFEKLRTLIADMLSKAPAHERNQMRVLGDKKKPGHFMRNWIAYSGLAIGSVALAWYAHTHSDRFHAWMDGVKDGAGKNWGILKGNVQALYDAFIGKDEVPPAGQVAAPEGDYKDLRRDLDVRLVELRDRLRGVRGELNNTAQGLRENNPQNPITQEQALAQCQRAVARYQATHNRLLNEGLVAEQEAHVAQEAQNINNVRFADLKPAIQRVLDGAVADLGHVAERANVQPVDAPVDAPAPVVVAVPVPAAPAVPVAANHIPAGFIRNRLGEPLAGDIDGYLDQANHSMQHDIPRIRNILGQANHFLQHDMPHIQAILDNDVRNYRAGSALALAALGGHTIELVNALLQLYQMEGGNLVGVGANIVGQLGNLIETVEHTVEPLRIGVQRGIELAEKGDQIITQNKVTALLAALVPAAVVAGGTFWSANKLYKTFKYKPDFQPMREALVYIGHLLNEEGIEKEAAQAQLDQGLVLYLVWKLKREAEHVPVLLRDQFLADVSKLGRSDLDAGKKRVWTADKKLEVIDLMYRTYDFLNPMYVVQ